MTLMFPPLPHYHIISIVSPTEIRSGKDWPSLQITALKPEMASLSSIQMRDESEMTVQGEEEGGK